MDTTGISLPRSQQGEDSVLFVTKRSTGIILSLLREGTVLGLSRPPGGRGQPRQDRTSKVPSTNQRKFPSAGGRWGGFWTQDIRVCSRRPRSTRRTSSTEERERSVSGVRSGGRVIRGFPNENGRSIPESPTRGEGLDSTLGRRTDWERWYLRGLVPQRTDWERWHLRGPSRFDPSTDKRICEGHTPRCPEPSPTRE